MSAPSLERLLQDRGSEHVVDHDHRARGVRNLSHRGDIDEVERRIGRCLEEEGLGVGTHGFDPGAGVAAVDQGRGDAEARTQILHDIAAGAEQGARGHDVVARLQEAQEGRGHGGHAGGGGARRPGAFEQAHALLEHGDSGIGVPAVDVAPFDSFLKRSSACSAEA